MKKLFTTCVTLLSILFMMGVYSYAETVSISGKVTQFSSNALSLNDIVIDVSGTKNVQVKTGRTGSYIVSGLPKGGTYTLTASKPGYTFQPATKSYRNLEESKVSQDFVAELATYSISGKVIVGGRPVSGVLITINNRPIKYYTDQNGEYVIDKLEYNGGPYEVSVVSDKHFFEPFKIANLEKNTVHDFRKDISISGRVTSLGQGIGGIEIDVNGAKYKTDNEGYYKINSVLANGDYVVKVVEEKFNPVPSSVPIKKITGDKFDVNFALSGQLIGKVTYNGQPFKNAIVTVSDREQEYKTNAQGMFNVPNLGLNQYYQISLSSTGYQFSPKERVINCLMRESSYQNFKVEIQKLSVTVSANQGKQPLENVDIVVNNNGVIHKTDKNGVCVIKDLPYGKKYTLTAKKQGITFVDSKKTIDKLQGDERVSFETKLSVSGKVLNRTKPLKDAIVTCGDKKVKTNAKGEYAFKDLVPSQNYTIKVSSANFAFAKEEIEITNLYEKLEDVDFTVVVSKEEEEALAKQAEEEKLKLEQEAKDKAEAEKQAKIKEAEEAKAKAEAEKKAKLEEAKAEQARIKAEKEEAARKAKEEKIKAKLEAEEAARKAKEEKARIAAEAKAKAEADKKAKEEQAKLDAEIKRLEAEEKAKAEADKKAKEEQAKLEAEAKAKAEAEKQAKIKEAEEAKAKAEAEKKAKLEAAKAEQARIKAEKEEAARKAKEEKIKAKLEAEEAARKAKEAKAKAEADKKAKEEQARLDAEIKRLEAEEKAKAEAEKQAKIKEAEEAKAKAEAEKKAAKEEQARIKAEKEEAARKAKEEKIKAKLEAEEAARKAKEEKAKAEADKKAKEEQARLDAEIKRLEAEEKAKAEAEKKAKLEEAKAEQARIKAEKAEAAKKAKEEKVRLASEARAKAEAEKKAAKEEQARIKAEKEEAARKAKEEKLRLKLEAEAEAEKQAKEEQARLEAEIKRLEQEEKEIAELEAKQKAEEEAKAKAEAEKQAKIKEVEEAKAKAEAEKKAKLEEAKAEQARIKAEKEEAAKKAKEEKMRAKLEAEEAAKKAKEEKERIAAEAKAKAEAEKQAKIKEAEEAKAEQARIKAEKEEAARKEKEDLLKKSKEESLEKNKLRDMGIESEIKPKDEDYLYIEGRVLKGKFGVSGVQIRLILEDEEKIFLTDKNGCYKVPELEKGKNYLITVLSGKKTLDMSPKSRTYKKLSTNMKRQNFYVIENSDYNKEKAGKKEGSGRQNSTKYDKRDSNYEEQEWNERYGFENKDGVIHKDIHW